MSAQDAYPLQAGVCPGCVPSPGRRLPWIRTLSRQASSLDEYPLQAGVYPGCVPSPGRRQPWMRTLSRQASALDAYPLQAVAAYVIRVKTIASSATFIKLCDRPCFFSIGLIDIIIVYKFYQCYLHVCPIAHPQVRFQPDS